MAKQIIVTKDNYGIEIVARLVNSKKEKVNITGQVVEVVIVDDTNTIVDRLEAQHVDSSKGIASIILEKKHTKTLGLYKTYWSSIDDDNHVTAQNEIYYYCKDKNGGVVALDDDGTLDMDGITTKFENIEIELRDIYDEIYDLKENNVSNEIVDARGGKDTLKERLDQTDSTIDKINNSLDNISPYPITKKVHLVKNNDWATVLQDCINEHKRVYIPDGEYDLSKEIKLPSGTEIIMSGNAKLNRTSSSGKMFCTEYTNDTKAYDGAINIRIKGGTINHGSRSNNVSVITLFHANNIVIEDVTILDTQGSHSVDIIGCNNVTIQNCRFKGYKSDTSGYFREAIQYDTAYASATGFSESVTPITSACYDGTRCKNIYILNNIFEESSTNPAPLNAIGTHTQYASNTKHENIHIHNNKLKGNGRVDSYGNAIRLLQTKNVFITNNDISNVMRGIVVDNSNVEYTNNGTSQNSTNGYNENINIMNNVIETCSGTNKNIIPIDLNCNNSLLSSGTVVNHNNIIISDNTLINNSDTESLRVETSSNVSINDNVIMNGKCLTIYDENCNNVVTKGNRIINNAGIIFNAGKINGCCDYIDLINNKIVVKPDGNFSTDVTIDGNLDVKKNILSGYTLKIGSIDEKTFRSVEVFRKGTDGVQYKARFGAGQSSKSTATTPSMELYNEDTKQVVNTLYLTTNSFFANVAGTDLGLADKKWENVYANAIVLQSPNGTNYKVTISDDGKVQTAKI